jgi:hypothetical protein
MAGSSFRAKATCSPANVNAELRGAKPYRTTLLRVASWVGGRALATNSDRWLTFMVYLSTRVQTQLAYIQ